MIVHYKTNIHGGFVTKINNDSGQKEYVKIAVKIIVQLYKINITQERFWQDFLKRDLRLFDTELFDCFYNTKTYKTN